MVQDTESLSLESFEPLPSGDQQYSASFVQHHNAMVLSITDEALIIGLCDPDDQSLRSRVEVYHRNRNPGLSLRFVRIEKSELLLYLGKQHRTDTKQDRLSGSVLEEEGVYLDKIANDAPVVNLVNTLILQAYNEGASDIHIDALSDGVEVRFRVDGLLRRVELLGREMRTALSSRIKVMAQLNIMERRLPQDGRCSVTVSGRTFDIRVSTLPSVHGESVVLRLLRKDEGISTLDTLGFDRKDLVSVRKILEQPHGLFLTTGPTGSGKTTSLHAMLRDLPAQTLKIITVEDPVEYQIDGITQMQTNEEIGLTFEAALRRILRQDPDVIMVGEIRDHSTASLAVRAALTGHLVLSSLHTNSATDSVSRLVDLGVEPYLLAAVLRGALGQRLVRRLCPACCKPADVQSSAYEYRSFGLTDAELAGVKTQGNGCSRCKGSGYSGRLLMYELLVPDDSFRVTIATDHRRVAALGEADLPGFASLPARARALLAAGATSLSEVRRVLFT